MKQISTTALAKERNLEPKALFEVLKEKGWILKKDDHWLLTKEGKIVGGDMIYNPKYGEYIVWPIDLDLSNKSNKTDTLTSTQIGGQYKLSAQRVNAQLSELGWIEKSNVGGWKITQFGKKNGGYELEAQTGLPYVVWNTEILNNDVFLNSIHAATGDNYNAPNNAIEIKGLTSDEVRLKYEALYRAQDGHRVRSRAEAMIDDYLYTNGIVHAYERALPGLEETVLSDFYIPKGKVYIEFWGMEDSKYLERKKKKKEIYSSEGFNLIELTDEDLKNLDDVLPRQLRKFGISVS